MATSLSAVFNDPTLTVTVTDTGTLSTLPDRLVSGVSGLTSLARSLSDGTGSNQAKDYYATSGTILAGADLDIDLTSLTGRRAQSINFAKVKWILIDIGAAAAGKYLLFKGSTATNPIALWKASAAANETIEDILFRTNPVDGWTVAGGAKVIRLNNPTASSIAYRVVIVGTT